VTALAAERRPGGDGRGWLGCWWLVVRWVPWSAVRLVPPLGLVLERRLLAGLIQKPMVFSTDVRVVIFWALE